MGIPITLGLLVLPVNRSVPLVHFTGCGGKEGLTVRRWPKQQLGTFLFNPFVPDPKLSLPAGPFPPRWKQHWLLSTCLLPLSAALDRRSLSPQKHSSFQNTLAWSSCPTLTRGSFSGLCVCPLVFSFFQRSQNGGLVASLDPPADFVWSSQCFLSLI